MHRFTEEELDLRILEALGVHGPRNFAIVARKLRLNADSLRKRMKRRLLPQIFLNINVYHTNLGLRKCVIFADAFKGKEELLYESLKTYDFWIYDSRCYGPFEGCLAIYLVPFGRESDLEEFLGELKRRRIARKVKHFWSTCFHTVNPTCNWFDAESKRWVFSWDKWVEEISSEKIDLPFSLVDPKEYPQKADYMDVFILKELEMDPMVSFSEIAKKLNVTKPTIKYHFENHIIKRDLMESFQVISFPFDKAVSDFYFFTFWFHTEEGLAKFAMSLLDKPFVRSLGKVFGQNGLFVQLYLPRVEFREFVDRLSELCRRGLVKSYWYVIQDWRKIRRDIIPFQHFSDGKWTYEQDKFLKQLDSVLEKAEVPQMQVQDKTAVIA